MNTPLKKLLLTAGLTALPVMASAQDAPAAVPTEVGYILTTLLFLIAGFLVFFMAAGFAMLEAGLVRSKNVTMQLTKNMGLFGFQTCSAGSPQQCWNQLVWLLLMQTCPTLLLALTSSSS